jgi:Transglycosylase SLT domain
VPNFFIDSFRIPPFLLPIYQAAGIEYDVPWQVLAGINEIETDYGRNLSVSTAGAVGWMQFLPSTWKTYGIDANGDGVADPYNPVDAIFSAARYLHAAGASTNLSNAILAYNHAGWYVQSVLLRAKLIGGMPDQLIGALTGLVQGHFPVAAPSKYADSSVQRLATHRVRGSNAAVPVQSDPNSKAVSIVAKQNSPVIAVNDGKIVKVGQNQQLGRYLQLQDQTGNIYTYAQLGSTPSTYPVPKPVKITAAQLAKELSAPKLPSPKAPATAGQQQGTPTISTAKATKEAKSAPITLPVTSTPTTDTATVAAPMVKERLFADPSRPGSYAAGGSLQLKNTTAQITSFQNYFSDVLHLGRNQYTLRPLQAGAVVVAGTILGRIGAGTQQNASHMQFMVQPAGKNAPQIDPKPILDGWKLLEATAVYRAAGVDPFFGPGAKDPTIGQILLMSKEQLTNRILQDPHVQIYACGRRDIQAGLIDRRVLATIEFLSASALDPSVSGLVCGHSLTGSGGTDAAGASGSSVDIAKVNNTPILAHQGPGSITDITIRRLLTLQGAMKPDQIISTMSYKGQTNTLALPDHNNRIQVTFTPLFGTNKKLSNEIKAILQPGQWIQLINRISQIPEPVVPIAPSKYAIHSSGH